jgi:hypothetical protein
VLLIIINDEMADVVLCEHQKNDFFSRCDHEGRFTFPYHYMVPKVAVGLKIIMELLTSATILLSRTRDRRAGVKRDS